jgi:hypothetical protein
VSQGEMPIRDILKRMRHDGCGWYRELVTGVDGASGLARRRIVVVEGRSVCHAATAQQRCIARKGSAMNTIRAITLAGAVSLATATSAVGKAVVVEDLGNGAKQYANDDGSQFCSYMHPTGYKNATLGFKISDNPGSYPLEVYYREVGKKWKSDGVASLKIGYHEPFAAHVYRDKSSNTLGFDVETKDVESLIAEIRDSSAFRISTPDGGTRTFPVKQAADAISSVRRCGLGLDKEKEAASRRKAK